ncbi:MAG: type IV pilin protein [Candidatus Dactylopiibacterium sp.]|nr:type IV pilin protein [Candidatus Dactylopiibacterium sp.]
MTRKLQPFPATDSGFTLIELMIVVAIVAILASIAYPSYSQYIVRGRLTDGQKVLASYALAQEQYFQNNNRYSSAAGASGCGVSTSASAYATSDFTLACTANSDTTYSATLTGNSGGKVAGYKYEIDDTGKRQTTQFHNATKSLNCWIVSDSSSC